MSTVAMQTTLRFVGDWPWWAGCAGALVLGGAAWMLYRRDALPARGVARVALPGLRALTVAMMVLMLSGPVLHHRTVIGQPSRLRIFVDGSRSMGLADPSMETGRKVLILQRLGLLAEGSVERDLPAASEALGDAGAAAQGAGQVPGLDAAQWGAIVEVFSRKAAVARDALAKGGVGPERVAAMEKDLLEPAALLAKRRMGGIEDRARAVRDLSELGGRARRWQAEVDGLFEKRLQGQSALKGGALESALGKFDALPRWQRLEGLLGLAGAAREGLLARLASRFNVELFVLQGGRATRLGEAGRLDSLTALQLPAPEGASTDLATAIKSCVGAEGEGQRGAVLVFSDGQHNEGGSPVEMAAVLGARGVPVYSIGFGSSQRVRDIALLKVEAPESVFFQDRIRGELVLNDGLAAGQAFTVSIRDGAKVLWQQRLQGEDRPLRRVAFDFPIKELVEARLDEARAGKVELSALAMELKASITEVEGESHPENNEAALRFQAVTQRRKILLVDGRARWETRYLRNLFERDEQWEVTAVIAGASEGEPGLLRGDKAEAFPADLAKLATYDLVIFGDVPRALWKNGELERLRDFVGKRGGAMVLVDGARGHLSEYAGSPLAELFPVARKGEGASDGIGPLGLTVRGADLAAFGLAPEDAQNRELWAALQRPHWVAAVEALPGAETLVEVERGGARVPVVVHRRFGAGQVLYHGLEDSWRWRYEVADLHHVKYWNQVANWLAELPFAVRGRFLSLDAGAVTYQPGESAALRVRLRDGEGRPVADATVDAVLYRDGRRVDTVRLAADGNGGGLYLGTTGALDPGSYEVAVETAALEPREANARAQFRVEPREAGELSQLGLNEELLQRMAVASGGRYLREEHLDELAGLLEPLSEGRVLERDTALWQSYWWFLPILALLTLEWIVRKRTGML